MKIKRYTARDMRQAMQKVREDQGPDAVILSSRRSDGMVEIVAAIDYDEALVREAVEPLRAERGRDVAELPVRAEAKPRAADVAEMPQARPRTLTPSELAAIADESIAANAVAPIRVAKFAPGTDVRHASDAMHAPIAGQAASVVEAAAPVAKREEAAGATSVPAASRNTRNWAPSRGLKSSRW